MEKINEAIVKKIIDLYSLFQFESLKKTDSYVIFRFNSGYFDIIEILVFDPLINTSTIKNEYEQIGYSVKIKFYHNYEEIHSSLFKGFFDLNNKRKYLKKNYESYYKQQTEHMTQINPSASYQYIKSSYYKDGEQFKETIFEKVGQEMLFAEKKLIILEASAGMGKTSTAYEIMNYILCQNQDLTIPLLIELTRNRGARIFRHVLDDEIDRNFTGLKRDLIVEEIKLGNILLIIDGFDELLSKQTETDEVDEENANQTMLDTIAELLTNESHARIILTSRKSSIFTGEQFELWKDQRLADVSVQRYQIMPPTINDWLEYDKIRVLNEKNIKIESLSNPVLLSILRILPFNDFQDISTGKSIIDLYLGKLLSREQQRQGITLDVTEQKNVFIQLAAQFVKFEIISEDSEFIKDILLENIFKDKIADYINRYTDSDVRPQNNEEFALKFVHHALLDRIKPFSNKIGFINEYIFGMFISEAIIHGYLSEENQELLNEKYIALVVDSCLIENEKKKEELYLKIKNIISCLSSKQSLETELALIGSPQKDYSSVFFDRMIISNSSFEKCKFSNCSFSCCSFQDCSFDSTVFDNCYFINCQFYENKLLNDKTLEDNASFINCSGIEFFNLVNSNDLERIEEDKSYEKIILENFWSKGKDKADSRRSVVSIFKGTSTNERKKVLLALNALVKQKILLSNAGYYDLNHKKMDIILEILGRKNNGTKQICE